MSESVLAREKVPQVYDRIAPVYDIWGKLTESRARERAMELSGLVDGQRVLEVAVGSGLNFTEVLQKNRTGFVEGIDVSPGMLGVCKRKAKKLGTNYRLQLGDARELPFEDGEFDLLYNHYMLDLLPFEDFPTVLREFKRVLKPGGTLCMVNMARGKYFLDNIYRFIYKIHPALLGGCRGVDALPFLEEQGFSVIHREFISQLQFLSDVIVAKKME